MWQPDEILDLHRSEIPTRFSISEQEEAQTLFSNFSIKDRKHFRRGLFVIEDPNLPKMGLSYRKPLLRGTGFCVHIPDFSAIVAPGTRCDQAAAERLQSMALPGQTLHLFPETLSFSTDRAIPTLSLIWRMDRKGRLKSFVVRPSACTVQKRLTPEEMDRAHHDTAHSHHRAIAFFHLLATRLHDDRTHDGSSVDIPDRQVDMPNQKVHVEPLPNQLAQRLLTELQVLSGAAIGRWCQDRELPAIFETRDEIENIETLSQIADPIVRKHEIHRMTPATKKSERAAFHHGLGISVYCPITDPANHYADLLMQRQINHQVEHRESYYTDEQLNTLRFQIQEMSATAHGIILRRQRDLLLQLWEPGQEVDATVLHIKSRGVLVELDNAAFKTIVYPGHRVQVGDKVSLRLTGINADQSQAHFTVLQRGVLSQA